MEAFVTFYSSNDWTAIGPEIALALAAMTILVMDLFGKDKFPGRTGLFAIAFQAVLLVAHLISYVSENSSNSYFSGMIEQSLQSDVMRSFFLLSSLLVSILAHRYLCKNRLASGEFHHLTMLATAGAPTVAKSCATFDTFDAPWRSSRNGQSARATICASTPQLWCTSSVSDVVEM